MHAPLQAGHRSGLGALVEALEDRQLFALAVVHQELHRPPLVMSTAPQTPPILIQQTVGIQLGIAGLLNGPVFGFDVYSPTGKGDYQVSGQFDANDNAPGLDIDSSIAVGDLNGDQRPDVALKLFSVTGQVTPVGEDTRERIIPFYNNGKGGFVQGNSIALDESFAFLSKKGYDYYKAHSDMAIADVNGDKVGDIVSWTGNTVTTILSSNPSTGAPQEKFKQEFGPTQASKKMRIAGVGDVDHDGLVDVIGFDETANSVTVRGWDPKTKELTTGVALPGPKNLGGPVTDIRVADFNGDGLSDLLFFSDDRYTIGLNVYKADAKTGPVYGFSWGTTQTLSPQLTSDLDVGVGDVDGNGQADLFTFKRQPPYGHVTLMK